MRNNIQFCLLTVVLVTLISACSTKEDIIVAQTRKFYMGTTPWPADFTAAEVDTSYTFINENCDIVSHHFDEGIPYEEFLQNQSLPVQLLTDVQTRKAKTNSNKKILLSVSALNLTRIQKADYYSHSSVSSTIKTHWNELPINHPNVVTAYVKYVNWLISELHPDYVNYGVESNSLLFEPSNFTLYKDFLSQVYTQLKSTHPTLPFLVSFIVDESVTGYSNAQQLIPYSDYIGLSAYPYLTISSSNNGNTDPSLFPTNYFEKFITMSNKPFCFAETSYIAENLVVTSYNLNKQSNEIWQRNYLDKVLQLTEKHQGKFIIWFCSKDYYAGTQTLINLGLYQDIFKFWEDTGLKSETGKRRPSFYLWRDWFQKSKI